MQKNKRIQKPKYHLSLEPVSTSRLPGWIRPCSPFSCATNWMPHFALATHLGRRMGPDPSSFTLGDLKAIPSPRGVLVGLAPQTKLQPPRN